MELLAQFQLKKFAGSGLGNLVDELVGVREPELREVTFEVLVQLLGRGLLPFFEDYNRHGALVPLLVVYGDHGCLSDGWVNERVL